MAKPVLYLSMSLDGCITGADDGPFNGLGNGGLRLHEWLGEPVSEHPHFGPPGLSGQVFAELMATGAVVVGRKTFDDAGHCDELHVWRRATPTHANGSGAPRPGTRRQQEASVVDGERLRGLPRLRIHIRKDRPVGVLGPEADPEVTGDAPHEPAALVAHAVAPGPHHRHRHDPRLRLQPSKVQEMAKKMPRRRQDAAERTTRRLPFGRRTVGARGQAHHLVTKPAVSGHTR